MYKKTKCKSCGTQNKPLFLRSPARDKDDFYCKDCMDKGNHLDK